MNTGSVESYLTDGCGRCDKYQTPECKVVTWAQPLVAADKSGGLDGIVVFRTDSETLSVSVAKDGAIIGGGTYRPDYQRWFPNGETCDDKPCQHAVVEVGLAMR